MDVGYNYTPTKAIRMNKVALAIKTYERFKDSENVMPYRQFRAQVIEQMRVDLGIPNAAYGTVGDYYCQARNAVTKRKKHFYHRTESTVNKTPKQRYEEHQQETAINAAFSSW